MRSLILALVFACLASVSLASDCDGHSCHRPVRSAVSHAVGAAKKVVTAPARAVRHRAACRASRRCRS